MVPKEEPGGWRACGDYSALNNATVLDRYPLPRIEDVTASQQRSTIFLKVDLMKAYHQIPVATEDISRTVIVTPFDLFEYLHMSFA